MQSTKSYFKIVLSVIFVSLFFITNNSFAQVGSLKNLQSTTQMVNDISKSIHPGDPWTIKNIITPEELLKQLDSKSKDKPVVLQTGFSILFNQGHIKGAKFAGPASREEGLKKLKEIASKIPKKKEVVIYCGCCGWSDCPNVHPAFKTLKSMGFKDLKVLYIPHNFTRDWVNKGLPVEE